jgi:hypothetical protein
MEIDVHGLRRRTNHAPAGSMISASSRWAVAVYDITAVANATSLDPIPAADSNIMVPAIVDHEIKREL